MLILTLPARAEGYYDGYRLMQLCQGQEKGERAPTWEDDLRASMDAAHCSGYITGVVDGLHTAETLSRSAIICEPNVRAGQIKMVVRRFLDAHPQYLHRSAADLIAAAVREAFPCVKTR
jgi:hypothetical protein